MIAVAVIAAAGSLVGAPAGVARADGKSGTTGSCATLVTRPVTVSMTESIVTRQPARLRVETRSNRSAGQALTVACGWVDLDGDGAYDADEPLTERRSTKAVWVKAGKGSKHVDWVPFGASAPDSLCVRTARAHGSTWEVSPVACDVPAPAPEIPEAPIVVLFGLSALGVMAIAGWGATARRPRPTHGPSSGTNS